MTDVLDTNQQREAIVKAAAYLSSILEPHFQSTPNFKPPRTLIICGSGLGGISTKLSIDNPPPVTVPYEDIPGFKKSTVPGHSGTLMFGSMNGSPVVLMNGRLHGYEGNTLLETTFPIRVINHMGHVHNLIVTNAAGGINAKYQACDLMCIYDHLNIPGPVSYTHLDVYKRQEYVLLIISHLLRICWSSNGKLPQQLAQQLFPLISFLISPDKENIKLNSRSDEFKHAGSLVLSLIHI